MCVHHIIICIYAILFLVVFQSQFYFFIKTFKSSKVKITKSRIRWLIFILWGRNFPFVCVITFANFQNNSWDLHLYMPQEHTGKIKLFSEFQIMFSVLFYEFIIFLCFFLSVCAHACTCVHAHVLRTCVYTFCMCVGGVHMWLCLGMGAQGWCGRSCSLALQPYSVRQVVTSVWHFWSLRCAVGALSTELPSQPMDLFLMFKFFHLSKM